MTSERHDAIWERLPVDRSIPDLEGRLKFLRTHVGENDVVLDLGCGDGAFASAIEREVDVVGVDVSAAALDRARRRSSSARFELVRETQTVLPLGDAAVDVVWVSEVLQHAVDPSRLLSEVRRVLKPGGLLLVTVPNHSLLRRLAVARHFDEKFGPYAGSVSAFTKRSLAGMLNDFDFELQELKISGNALRRDSLRCLARKPSLSAPH